MATERGRVEVEARLRNKRKFQADAYESAHAVDEIGDAAQRADVKIMGLNARVTLFRNALGLVRPAALVTGLGLAAQGIGALGAGTVALTGALGPLSGLMVAYPGLGLAAAQGFLAWKFAMGGVMDAVGGLNQGLDPKKLGQLSDEGQRFAIQLDAMKSQVRGLQTATQDGLFPGVRRGLRDVSPLLADFRDEANLTGAALGHVVSYAGQFTRQAGPDLQVLAKRNALHIARMGNAGVNLASALRHVLVAAGPLLGWLTKSAEAWSLYLDRSAAAGRESGKLARFFWKTRVVATSLWHTLRDVGMALLGIAKGGSGLGGDMLKSLERGAASFRAWSEGAKGQRQIVGYFREMRPAVYEVSRLARDLVLSLVRLSNGPGLAPMIRDLRTKLLPALESILTTTTASFGPVLIDGLVRLGDLAVALSGSTGPLTLLVITLGHVASAAAWLFRTVPGASQLAAVLLTLGLAARAVKFAAMVTGLKRLYLGATTVASALSSLRVGLGAMKAVYLAQTGAANASTLAVLRHAAAQKGAAMWARVATGSFLGLNLAMLANPAVLIAAGIIALGAAFYLAYTKVEWFHNAVDSTFSWIKGHWPLLVGVIAPLALPIALIADNFDRLKAAGVGAWDAVKNAVGGAVRWMVDRLRQFLDFLGRVGDKIAGIPGVKQALGAGKFLFNHSPTGLAVKGAKALIPGLATGGVVRRSGGVLVGEQGPELLSLQKGARVDPLPRLAKAATATRPAAELPGIAGILADVDTRLAEVTIPVYLDGKVIYEAVGTVARDRVSRK
jgi:hypothetical protein